MNNPNDSALLDISREDRNSPNRAKYQSMITTKQQMTKSTNMAKWANAVGQNMNKSEIVGDSKYYNAASLPEKLLKMKERVKRDRSANQIYTNENRLGSASGSLYGRKKVSDSLDEQTQKLRDSYNKHRKPNSRSQVPARSMLQKQNFKEDPFDDGVSGDLARDNSYDQYMGRDTIRQSDKENQLGLRETSFTENGLQLQNQNESLNTQNRYKRSQLRSHQALASYQQKYERLEKNFKKFSHNIKHANQSEQIIDDLKIKTGLSILVQHCRKTDFKDIRQSFKIWRLNSGIAQKQYENQEKTLVLAKYANKFHQKTLNHVKIQFYQKWKKLALNSSNGSSMGPDRVISKFSQMITSTEEFNRCVESDFYLSQILNEKLTSLLGGLATSDILFYDKVQGDEVNPTQEFLKGYNDETGEQVNFSIQSLMSHSLIGRIFQQQKQGISERVTVSEAISSQPMFNREIDMPLNQFRINQMNKQETNAFNKVRQLSMVMVNLDHPLKIGILRLYFTTNTQNGVSTSPTVFQMKQINHISRILPQFLQRILDVRSQINSLALKSMDQIDQIQMLESFNQINQNLKTFQETLYEIQTSSSTEQLLLTAKSQIEEFLVKFFDFENITLRQITKQQDRKQNLLLPNDPKNKDLVRFTDHIQEAMETMEDFLDYKKEYYVHQISVCPKEPGPGNYSDFTFIMHIYNKYQNIENLRDLRDLSTSLNSNNLGITNRIMQSDKKYLDDELKHKLGYYFRSMVPILRQSLLVSAELAPRMQQLESSLQADQKKYEIQQYLQRFVSNQQLIEETDESQFSIKMSEALLQALIEIVGPVQEGSESQFFALYNKYMFFNQNCVKTFQSNLQFQSYLDGNQLQFLEEIFESGQLKKRKESSNIVDLEGGSQVNIGAEILPSETSIIQNGDYLQIVQPVMSVHQNFTNMVAVAFKIHKDQLNHVNDFCQEVQAFIADFINKRQSYQSLQGKHDKLLCKLEGEKMSQQTKEMIDETLIIPFIKKQTLKSLGEGIDILSDRLVQNGDQNEDGTWGFGQEISQIAFIGPNTYIEDVRLLQSYSQVTPSDSESAHGPDQMMLQSYMQKQQIIYEDELLGKIVVLYPIMQGTNFATSQRQSSDTSGACLIIRFVINKDENAQKRLDNIHTQLLNCVQPIVGAALSQGQVFTKQALAVKKLTGVVDRYRFANYREIIYFLRDLKSKNVYNFSRSRLFDKIAKSRRFIELKQATEEGNQDSQEKYFDVEQKHLAQNQLIQHMIRQALKVMNKQAQNYKQICFKRFVVGTKKPLYANMSKKKKKAICSLVHHYTFANLRSIFSKFAINTQQFRRLSHPKTKYLASVQCMFRNYRLVKERLAFLKLKKNLNLQLRASMQSYQDADKDLFIQLNQILVSSYQQQGGLEGGFSYALSEIFAYLKNLSNQDLIMKDVGQVATNSFVGHIDEVVLTMKSQVYTSHSSNNLSSSNQKTRIFMTTLNENQNQASQTFQRGKPLRLSYDSNIHLSQQDQILNQINASNVDNNFDNESLYLGENDFENQLSQSYQKFVISQKRDLIHQMLVKSNGIVFNFQNIQQSLSDIFLSQQSHLKDQNVGNRFAIVRRSKSALIIPLFDVSQQTIIGSLELYRHHQQAFTEEIESRYDFFAKRLSDFFLIYGQLKAQTFQIEQLKQQMQKSIKPSQSLSLLLKNVYVNAPGQHFPGACHVLPIIILNQEIREQLIYENEIEFNEFDDMPTSRYIAQKLAFFYQFKDNHIYNFDYEGTFIEELMDNGCILEMCQKSSKDEAKLNGQINACGISVNDSQVADSSRSKFSESGRLGVQKHKTIESSSEKVKSVTNQLFKHIVYYPVFDLNDPTRIIAIFEVAFKKKDEATSDQIITDDVQQYLDQFRSNLDQFRVRLSSFSKNLEGLFVRRQQKRHCQLFQQWKQQVVLMRYKEQFQNNQFQALQNQEMCYSEYMQNLDNYNQQLRAVSDEKERLQTQLNQFTIEKKAKLKFLATSLVSSQNLFKRAQTSKLKQAFIKWQYNVSIRKIAETAFSRVLELNHRHSRARFKTAVYLMQNLVENIAVRLTCEEQESKTGTSVEWTTMDFQKQDKE